MDIPEIKTLAAGVFPEVVWLKGADEHFRRVEGWRFMIAAGRRCEVGTHLSCADAPPVLCQVMDGAHAGVRFDPAGAQFE